MNNELLKLSLAWDMVSCAQAPPMQPTTSAVLRAVALLGEATKRQLRDIIPCSEGAVNQQVVRLARNGLLMRRQEAGKSPARYVYTLSPSGRTTLLMWDSAVKKMYKKLP